MSFYCYVDLILSFVSRPISFTILSIFFVGLDFTLCFRCVSVYVVGPFVFRLLF